MVLVSMMMIQPSKTCSTFGLLPSYYVHNSCKTANRWRLTFQAIGRLIDTTCDFLSKMSHSFYLFGLSDSIFFNVSKYKNKSKHLSNVSDKDPTMKILTQFCLLWSLSSVLSSSHLWKVLIPQDHLPYKMSTSHMLSSSEHAMAVSNLTIYNCAKLRF